MQVTHPSLAHSFPSLKAQAENKEQISTEKPETESKTNDKSNTIPKYSSAPSLSIRHTNCTYADLI